MFSFIFNYRSDFEFRQKSEKSAPLLKTSTTDGELVLCHGPKPARSRQYPVPVHLLRASARN